ncbi:MAG TPA: XRE family transcriptional regulator [Planctomycetota bacterium]|nr:XRE family transcriptional regulator [Planctomycetota bacterium]
MEPEVLAQNVRRLRTAKRLSQAELADRAAISVQSVKNLERARGASRVSTLQEIARVLEVKLQDLFLPVRELKTVRFRSSKRMRDRENILAEVARWLEDFNSLEDILGQHLRFSLGNLRSSCSRDEPVVAAKECRRKLGLKPTEPIYDICGLLEHAGVKVQPVEVQSDGFFGLSVAEEDGGPAVITNTWERITVERRIFSAAHELGHLMLHPDAYDGSKTDENKEEEREANLFAGHFMLPEEGFRKEWNEAAGLPWVIRTLKVKRIFNVSYKTVLNRLIEQGEADEWIWKRFNIEYQRHFKRKLAYRGEPEGPERYEPSRLHKVDFSEDRLSLLVRRAVEEDKITISRAAEILRISIEEMQELLKNWEALL